MTEIFKALTVAEIKSRNVTRTIRVYADGVYDLFHYGHIEQLKQAKTAFGNIHLIVGVVTDEDCLKYKGGPTVMTHEERVKSVAICSLVDEVISHPPFYPTLEFIDKLKIDLVAHDAVPYEINEDMSDIEDCYAPFKVVHCLKNQLGLTQKNDRFLETTRTPLISTTDLVHRIVSRVDEYRERNKRRGIVAVV